MGESVAGIVLRAAAVTGSLVLGGVLLLVALVLPLGPFLASRSGSALDRTILLVTLAFVSTHPLVAALLLQLLVGRKLGWLPDQGYCPFFGDVGANSIASGVAGCGGPVDWATHLLLPWLSFSLLFLALYLRQIRTQSSSVLREPFINVARAKGASERRVLNRHVVPSVLAVVVVMVAMDVGTALGVALFIEVVYGLPGLGRQLIVALQGFAGFDRPVIVGIVLVTGAVVILANLAADLLVGVIDPRARTGGGRGRGSGPATRRGSYSPAGSGGHHDANPGRPGTRPSEKARSPSWPSALVRRSAIRRRLRPVGPVEHQSLGMPRGPWAGGAKLGEDVVRAPSRSAVTSWTRPIRRAVAASKRSPVTK